jgi:hypothetical protein
MGDMLELCFNPKNIAENSSVALAPGQAQRYLTLIDGGLVYTALSSPWGRFSDYSATDK